MPSLTHILRMLLERRARGERPLVSVGGQDYEFVHVGWGGVSPTVQLVDASGTASMRTAAEWRRLGAEFRARSRDLAKSSGRARKIAGRWQPTTASGVIMQDAIHDVDGTGYATREGAVVASREMEASREVQGRTYLRQRSRERADMPPPVSAPVQVLTARQIERDVGRVAAEAGAGVGPDRFRIRMRSLRGTGAVGWVTQDGLPTDHLAEAGRFSAAEAEAILAESRVVFPRWSFELVPSEAHG